MATPKDLARKTKPEILEEYRQLQEQLEAARRTAQQVHEPASQELLAKAETYAGQDILQAVTNVRTTVNTSLNQVAEAISSEVNHLQELRAAVAVLQQNLEHHHHLKVAADAIETLIRDYELKKRQFDSEAEQRRFALEAELDRRQREWERAQEEKDYEARRQQKQAEIAFDDKITRREKELTERAEQLKQQETDSATLRQQVEDFSKRLEQELSAREHDVTARLTAESDQRAQQLLQEHEGQRRILELQITTLQEQTRQQQTEMAALKQAADQANRHAQDLASKVIEGTRPLQVVERDDARRE